MIEPILRFREWHLVPGNSFKNVGGRAPRARGIWKSLAQPSTQHLQKALFGTLGIFHCVQKFLHSADSNPLHRQRISRPLSRLFGLSCL